MEMQPAEIELGRDPRFEFASRRGRAGAGVHRKIFAET